MPSLIAAATCSSSLMRMRGAASNSVTRDPKAPKIEATCTPVAPAPITSIESGTDLRRQASLWVQVNSNPGTASRRDAPPVQMMTLLRSKSRRVLALDHVRVDEAGGAGVLVDGHSGPLELVAQERVRAHVTGHLAHASEQAPIVERRLVGGYSVARELSRLPNQPGRVGQRPHRHRPVVRGHSPELVARDERRSSSEPRRAKSRDDARGPGADHDQIEFVCACGRHFAGLPGLVGVCLLHRRSARPQGACLSQACAVNCASAVPIMAPASTSPG